MLKQSHTDPRAAACLRELSREITGAWANLVCRQTEAPLVPGDLLLLLADALEDPDWVATRPIPESLGTCHGPPHARLPSCNPGTIIDAYAMLRHTLCENMAARGPWPQATMARIHACIDTAMRTAVQAHTGQRDASQSEIAFAQAELKVAQQERDEAHDAYDASRGDVAALLEHKKMRERVIELLSHDLRSPLSSIVLNAQRLAKNIHNVELASLIVPRIIRATQRMDHMIQDILDASRLQAGQGMPISDVPCDMAQIAAEVHEDFASVLGTRLKLRIPQHARGIWDRGALRRVLDNLVGNAVKYGERNTEITIAVDDTPQAVRVSVHNHGHPLSEQELTHLFEPYVRTRAAQSGDQTGWGLGLTLVHGVVSAHKGSLGASSSNHAGTTFWFELPKQADASEQPPA